MSEPKVWQMNPHRGCEFQTQFTELEADRLPWQEDERMQCPGCGRTVRYGKDFYLIREDTSDER